MSSSDTMAFALRFLVSSRQSIELSYHEITAHYHLTRRRYPPAHPALTNAEERLWRLMQTNTLSCRARLHVIYPTLYSSRNCPAFGAQDTIVHNTHWRVPGVGAGQLRPSDSEHPNGTSCQGHRQAVDHTSLTQTLLK